MDHLQILQYMNKLVDDFVLCIWHWIHMNQCMDLDIVEQCKHDSKDILDGSHIQVDNLARLQAFPKHMSKQHDRL